MEQLKAGRELDALVAEKVMDEPEPIYVPDWDRVTLVTFNGGVLWSEKGNWYWICDGDKNDGVFCYPRPFSTDMAAAWKVWERVIADKHLIDASLHGDVRGRYYVKFTINGQATADTAPLAICLAALKAVGVDYGTS